MSTRKKIGQLTTPGERLGVIEELAPSRGTYVSNGVIYSATTGFLTITDKIASVYRIPGAPVVPYRGSMVIGQVVSVSEKVALVAIFKIGRKFFSLPAFTGILHISMVGREFVRSMFDVCRNGDVVRARVMSVENLAWHLSVSDVRLGVIYAFCSKCGEPLILKGDTLICSACGNKEVRKVSSDYGRAVV